MSVQPPATGDWHAEWSAALDALEVDVVTAERMLAGDHQIREAAAASSWAPPRGLGPLPLDLRPRADAILARQIEAARAIALALVGNRRQAAMLSRVESGGDGGSRPVYINCAA